MLFALDWTPIVAAAVAALPGCLAAFVAILNRRQLQTKSGDTIGHMAERTHDLSAAGVALGTQTVKILNGAGAPDAETTPHD